MIVTNPKNILIADDDLLFRLMMHDALKDTGHFVSSTRDGLEAICEIKKKAVDLLILDLEMPQMSGFEVMKSIKSSSFQVPKIFVVTGAYSPASVMKIVKDLGAVGILQKGFTPEQLIFRVNRILYPVENNILRRRVPVSIPVTYSFASGSGVGSFANLSEGGAFLRTHEVFSIGEPIELEFILPGSASRLRIKGEIRWSTDQIGKNINFGGYGIMFSELDACIVEQLREYVR